MSKGLRITILVVVALAVVGVLRARQTTPPRTAVDAPAAGNARKAAAATGAKAAPKKDAPKVLPRLLDLGAKSCVPCKMMASVLEELTTEYKGRLDVVFIDVYENPQPARDFAIRGIPTQIFSDARGEEFFRHEGYMAKADILAKFKEHGIDLGGGK